MGFTGTVSTLHNLLVSLFDVGSFSVRQGDVFVLKKDSLFNAAICYSGMSSNWYQQVCSFAPSV